jgi:DNA polymerase-3 subunit beta
MKFRIDREELLRGLGRIQAIVERRGTLPILANALIQARSAGLTLAATDLEVGVVAQLPAEIEAEGELTLGAKKLFEIVREFEDSEVVIESEEGSRTRVECGPARFSLLAIPAEEYPTIPGPEGVAFAELDAPLLASMIDSTLYAVSTDETRYNLNGVYMELVDGKRLRFVATDGHRLAMVDRSLARPVPFLKKGIIVPRKGMSELRKLCDEAEGSIEIGLGDGFLLMRRPGLRLSTRLIDGEFPNYRQVVPKDQRVRLVLDRERFSHSVRRVSLVAHERSRQIRVTLENGALELHASNPDLGEAREKLEIDYQGDRFQIAFNARYLADVLAATTSKEVVLELLEEVAPARILPADDPDWVAVIMPMRA